MTKITKKMIFYQIRLIFFFQAQNDFNQIRLNFLFENILLDGNLKIVAIFHFFFLVCDTCKIISLRVILKQTPCHFRCPYLNSKQLIRL